jgi:hypothetical protein
MKKGFVGFALMCAVAAHLPAAEAPSREALEKMFVMREAEWAAPWSLRRVGTRSESVSTGLILGCGGRASGG